MITCPNCGNLTKEQIELYNQNLRRQNFSHIPILPTCKFCQSAVRISHKCHGGKILVLTGTCGSGKSIVVEILAQKGFLAIDGDCAIQAALARCQTRTCHKSVTPEYWINYFYDLLQYDDEVEIVDNTNMTAEETADYIVQQFGADLV